MELRGVTCIGLELHERKEKIVVYQDLWEKNNGLTKIRGSCINLLLKRC